MKKQTQLNYVKNELLKNCFISRNDALKSYCTRLSARIQDLVDDGWVIEGRWVKTETGKDYQYFLISSPYKKVEYRVPSLGKIITAYEKVSK